jgi:hypothetical protein
MADILIAGMPRSSWGGSLLVYHLDFSGVRDLAAYDNETPWRAAAA